MPAPPRRDLRTVLLDSTNGLRLVEIGLGEDVAWCARESVLEEVAVMRAGAIRLHASASPKRIPP